MSFQIIRTLTSSVTCQCPVKCNFVNSKNNAEAILVHRLDFTERFVPTLMTVLLTLLLCKQPLWLHN